MLACWSASDSSDTTAMIVGSSQGLNCLIVLDIDKHEGSNNALSS